MTGRRLLPSLALAGGLVALLPATPASAAPYAITRCTYSKLPTSPAGTRAPVLTGVGTVVNDLCGDGFGWRFDFSNHTLNTASTSRTGMRLALPASTPDLTIVSVAARLTLRGKSGDKASAGSLAFVDEASGASSPITSWGGEPTTQFGPVDVATPATWKGTRSVLLGATCGSTCTFSGAGDRDFKIEKLTFVLDDPSAPAEPTFMATGLLAPGAVQGTQTLSLAAADDGSGVERVEVLTPGGAVLATTPPKDRCVFSYAEACPPTRAVELPIDTARLVPGAQQLQVRIFNAAGLARTVDTPVFTVPGPKPAAVPNGDDLGAATIVPRKGATGARKAASVAFGSALRLRGRLRDRSGRGMAGVQLDVLVTPAGSPAGTRPTVAATLLTNGRGEYDHRLQASAAATVSIAYPRHRGAGDYAASRALVLDVRPEVALRAARSVASRGSKVTLAGRVRFAPQPAAGTPVAIQVQRGGRWRTIDVVALREEGRFRWTHRFGTAGRYRFRARTYRSAALPTGTSPVARLRVR